MCNGREGPRRRSAFKSCRDACNAAEVSDMSEAAQAEGGIDIKDKRFDFETCRKSSSQMCVCPRFMMLRDVLRKT
jgi:hypothetical protein